MTHPDLLLKAISETDGEPQVSATWAAEHRDAFTLIDVREPHELEGPLGAVEGARNLPLLRLLGRVSSFDADEPIVLLCRSGRRSGQAAEALQRAGLKAVASVEGGILAWRMDVDGQTSVATEEKVANTDNLHEAIYRTNGLPEVSSDWVASNLGRFRLIDVRQPEELVARGAVAQAENIPLETFMGQANELDRDTPLVIMCQSGGRSGRVTRALESAGFTAVASMEGGMFGWRARQLPAA